LLVYFLSSLLKLHGPKNKTLHGVHIAFMYLKTNINFCPIQC